MVILKVRDSIDGDRYYGPFGSEEEARSWAGDHLDEFDLKAISVEPLTDPDEA